MFNGEEGQWCGVANQIRPFAEEDGKIEKVLNGCNLIVLERDCNGEQECYHYGKRSVPIKKDKSILIYKNEGKFYPIYEKNDKGDTHLFDTKSKLLKDVMDNI